MMILKIDEDTVLKIERAQYEVESRKDVIAQILSGNLKMNTEAFKKYHDDYQNHYAIYNQAKREMMNKYLKNTEYEGKSWNLDFESKELTIFD